MTCDHQNRKEMGKFGATSLYQCENCDLIFTNFHGDDFNPKAHYENFYKNEIGGRFGFGVEYVIRLFRFFRAFKIFTICPRAKSILDIGSGRGFMLYYLKKYYHYRRAEGTQISKNALEFSRLKLGLKIYDSDLLDVPLNNYDFDLVTMWHVLEHVSQPEKYIEKITELLNEQGTLIVEVPNFNSWTRKLTGQYWLGLDLQNHIGFFTPKSLCLFLEKYKLKILKIRTFSLEYSTFISTQSIVSRITKTDQLVFNWLQAPKFNPQIIFHSILFFLIAPFCFFINCLLYFSRRGEIILVIAKKQKNNYEKI